MNVCQTKTVEYIKQIKQFKYPLQIINLLFLEIINEDGQKICIFYDIRSNERNLLFVIIYDSFNFQYCYPMDFLGSTLVFYGLAYSYNK